MSYSPGFLNESHLALQRSHVQEDVTAEQLLARFMPRFGKATASGPFSSSYAMTDGSSSPPIRLQGDNSLADSSVAIGDPPSGLQVSRKSVVDGRGAYFVFSSLLWYLRTSTAAQTDL